MRKEVVQMMGKKNKSGCYRKWLVYIHIKIDSYIVYDDYDNDVDHGGIAIGLNGRICISCSRPTR